MAAPRKATARSGKANPLKGVPAATYDNWDDLVQETAGSLTPYRLRVSDDEVLTIECPTDDDMHALGQAEQSRDRNALAIAVFGQEHAVRILELCGDKPFIVLAKLVERVMVHYGLQGVQGPEGSASGRS